MDGLSDQGLVKILVQMARSLLQMNHYADHVVQAADSAFSKIWLCLTASTILSAVNVAMAKYFQMEFAHKTVLKEPRKWLVLLAVSHVSFLHVLNYARHVCQPQDASNAVKSTQTTLRLDYYKPLMENA